MTAHLVTFSDASMSRAAELCVDSAGRYGVDNAQGEWASECIYSQKEIEYSGWADGPQFDLLDLMRAHPRGCGFWAWKPFVILEAMNHCGQGDILVYADAGIEFIAPVSHIIERMDQDIFLFGNNWEHAHWCKRDVVQEIFPITHRDWYEGCSSGKISITDDDEYLRLTWGRFGKQVQASVIFFRVSDYSRAFVAEWLDWCLFEGGRLIDDSPSRAPNHPEFREHRHDQAILTTMAYRDGLTLHWWPAVYNRGSSPEFVYEKLPEYARDYYPVIFSHHRKRDHEWGS